MTAPQERPVADWRWCNPKNAPETWEDGNGCLWCATDDPATHPLIVLRPAEPQERPVWTGEPCRTCDHSPHNHYGSPPAHCALFGCGCPAYDGEPQERPVAGDAEALHDAKRRCFDPDCACQGAPWPQGPVAGDGLDREAVRRRAEAATPGPWEWDDLDGDPGLVSRSVTDKEHGEFGTVLASWPRFVVMGYPTKNGSGFPALDGPDAEFIANARTDVPALLGALEAAEAEVRRLRPYARWCPVCESWFVTKESCVHPQAVMLYERTEGGASCPSPSCDGAEGGAS